MKSLVISNKTTKRESEAFKKYLSDIAKIKPFESPEQEYECAMLASKGDRKAKQELIRRNLRFVVSCAKQYQQKGVTLEDLVNEGNVGISAAADRFDPTLGHKFISYAVWWIRKEILYYISNNSRFIRLPNNKVDAVSNFKKNMSALEQILQRPITTQDMLDNYPAYTEEDIELLFELTDDSVTSLDLSMGEDDTMTLGELIGDNTFGRTDDLVTKADLKNNIESLFSILNPMEKEILTMLYGLNGYSPSTLSDVGNKFDMSRENVRQKRDKALRKIGNRHKKYIGQLLTD
jgi:RNA polymerase primary sigma factor